MSGSPSTPWEGRFLKVQIEGRWEYVSRARGIRAAVIVAIADAGTEPPAVILVEQHRVPLGRACLELPAGLVGDDEGGAGEDAAVAAARELEEETGYRAETMRHAGLYFSSPGMVSEGFDLFIARGLTRVGPGGGVDGEDIIVHRVPLSEVASFIEAKRASGVAIDTRMLLLTGAALIAG